MSKYKQCPECLWDIDTHGFRVHVESHSSEETRFWAKVVKTQGGCWRWAGKIKPNGYGGFENTQAHRVAWLLSGRTIPDGLQLDHLCRKRWCVNPDHLEAVTPAENLRRAGPHYNSVKTHCKQGHPLSGTNMRLRGTWRVCRTCASIYARRSEQKERVA